MKIEAIDEATIKVVLTNKEMNAYHLSYETMDSNDTATKKLLWPCWDGSREKPTWIWKTAGCL